MRSGLNKPACKPVLFFPLIEKKTSVENVFVIGFLCG